MVIDIFAEGSSGVQSSGPKFDSERTADTKE